MAINAQQLLAGLNSTDLSSAEQICVTYLEGLYDKEIIKSFSGFPVSLRKQTYFTDILREMNINKGRDPLIFMNIVALYATAGWTVTFITQPQYDVINFAITPL